MDKLTNILLTIIYIIAVIWSFSTYGFVLGIVVSIIAAPVISMIATFLIIIIFTILFSLFGANINSNSEAAKSNY